MTDPIDQRLTAQTMELLKRIEAELPPGYGAMFQFYNYAGRDLDLICATLGRRGDDDGVRVLRAVLGQWMHAHARPGRQYVAPADASPAQHVVSSAQVLDAGAHEIVRVWSRGGLAGEIVVSKGDGARMCTVMFGLLPAP